MCSNMFKRTSLISNDLDVVKNSLVSNKIKELELLKLGI